MPLAEVSDASAADFAAGTAGAGVHVARAPCAEVLLAPELVGEFTGGDMPAGWSAVAYHDGGGAHLGPEGLTLDGARVGCDRIFRGPPRVVDLSATFAPRPDQHAGFGVDFVHVPWVMFSTKWGRRLYARTHHVLREDKPVPGAWFGGSHRYRIEWNLLDIVFSIDGERAAYLLVPVPGYMRALAGNQRLGGAPLRVEWMRVSPYAAAGTFTSRPIDAGAPVEWVDAVWQADMPPPTSLAVSIRTGEGDPGATRWSRWRRLARSGSEVGATARHIQYRVALATTADGATPALRRITFRHRPAGS